MIVSSPFIFLGSFLVGLSCAILFINLSLKKKVLVLKGMPLIGGVSMGPSFMLACLFSFGLHKILPQEILGIIAASLAMLAFGIIDDVRELSVRGKFFAQIIAASLLILFGVRTHIAYIGNALNLIITFIWVIGITNAFNLLDVADGLSAGTALIVSLGFLAVSILNADINSIILSLSLTGPIIAFLIYNKPPARVYMGNSGSHFLGFVLAALALLISYAPLERKIALLSPILILWLPILDTATVIAFRLIKKNIPFKKSNDHIVLRLLAAGYSKRKALIVMLVFGLFFSGCGVLISRVPNKFGALIVVVMSIASLLLVKRTQKNNC